MSDKTLKIGLFFSSPSRYSSVTEKTSDGLINKMENLYL